MHPSLVLSKMFNRKEFILVLIAACLWVSSGNVIVKTKDWYEHATFYQIYPRSFQDSGDDGIGDLRGIISRIDHLKLMNITATWLSPPFVSPLADFGYDVSDFYNIQPEYGTLQDFDDLIEAAHKVGIKVMLDFIPNHSSDEHQWFIDSNEGVEEFNDFYVWKPARIDEQTKERKPPNNWISVFGGPAWTWSESRQMYYLHQFTPKQPDLNYRNIKVREEMEKVFMFWMDRGCDGFRLDAINHMYEDELFRDEPLTGWNVPEDSYDYLEHIYTKDVPDVYDLIYDWREIMDEYSVKTGSTKILMTEAYADIDQTMLYYQSQNGERQGAHMPFNFGLIHGVNPTVDSFNLKKAIDHWLDHMPVQHTSSWVVGSHDHSRVGSRLGEDRIDQMNTLVMTLPGTSISYYGEEIGMVDHKEAQQYDNRDPNRTPMQWDDTKEAGFTTGNSSWLKIHPNYKLANVKVQQESANSHLHHFSMLSSLRKHRTMADGDYLSKTVGKQIFAFTRELRGHDSFAVVVNLDSNAQKADLSDFVNLPKKMFVVASGSEAYLEIGSEVEIDSLLLEAYGSIVLQASSAIMSKVSVGVLMAMLLNLFIGSNM